MLQTYRSVLTTYDMKNVLQSNFRGSTSQAQLHYDCIANNCLWEVASQLVTAHAIRARGHLILGKAANVSVPLAKINEFSIAAGYRKSTGCNS